jgi:hypothetical protein
MRLFCARLTIRNLMIAVAVVVGLFALPNGQRRPDDRSEPERADGFVRVSPGTPGIAEVRLDGTTWASISGGHGSTGRRTEVQSPACNA